MRVPTNTRAGMTLIEILVAALIFTGLLVLILVLGGRAIEANAVTKCRENLRLIGLACVMYSGNDRGYWPAWHGARREFHGWTLSDVSEQGKVAPQGIGLVLNGGFVSVDSPVFLCPGAFTARFRREAQPYASLFSLDTDEPIVTEPYWRIRGRFTDNDGVMELGGDWGVAGGDKVIVSTYWMRVSSRPFGAFDMDDFYKAPLTGHRPTAMVSDTILGWTPLPGVDVAPEEPTFISNHDGVWNVLFIDGSVKTYHDTDDALERRLGELKQMGREDCESAVGRSRLIFEEFFDPVYSE